MIKLRLFFYACVVLCSSLVDAQIINDDVRKLVDNNNDFAFKLFHKITEENENVCFSPYSISSALAMTYAGAETETKQEMRKVLGFSNLDTVLNSSFSWLNGYLAADYSDRSSELHIFMANSIWIQTGEKILPNFLEVMTNFYHSSPHEIDFIKHNAQARAEINKWITEKSSGKIENLIKPDDLTEATRMVLASATYLKATWKAIFDKKETIQGTFFKSSQENISVPMMTNTGHFNYFNDDHFALLELPYAQPKGAQQHLVMMIFLPQENFGANKLEQLIDAESLKRWVASLKSERISVFLPRFKILERLDLNEALTKLGMPIAFSNMADFSGINGAQDLKIGKVLHKAFISVNEEGTEAAAATSVIMKLKSAPDQKKAIIFRVDHPFIYMIYEKNTGTILFLGRVIDPSAREPL